MEGKLGVRRSAGVPLAACLPVPNEHKYSVVDPPAADQWLPSGSPLNHNVTMLLWLLTTDYFRCRQ